MLFMLIKCVKMTFINRPTTKEPTQNMNYPTNV